MASSALSMSLAAVWKSGREEGRVMPKILKTDRPADVKGGVKNKPVVGREMFG
jgi:hypothetical protein